MMKAKTSPLHLLDFAITKLEFGLIAPEDLSHNVTDYFHEYDVDIDFSLSKDDLLKVSIRAEINREENRWPGYSLLAEAACIFQFDKQANLPDDVKGSLEGFSTIYIALNSLRGLISNFTANAPFGRYILPSIDLNDLIEKKKKQLLIQDRRSKPSSSKTGKKAKPKTK